MSDWISVKDRLPDSLADFYLCCISDENGMYEPYPAVKTWIGTKEEFLIEPDEIVTHWKEIIMPDDVRV